MKIRLIWDECPATVDRRRLTKEDIDNDIHLEEFESEDDLIKHLCNLSKCNEDDLEDCGEDNRAKIDCLLSSMNDRGDGTPNILFLSIDGDIIQDWLNEVDGLTCSEQDVKDEQMRYVEDRPWDYDEEFDFDDEYEEDLDEGLNSEDRTFKVNSSLTLNELDLSVIDEIANSYSTSSPVSGNWETETLDERNEIAETLKISYTDANDIMVKYLGFDQSEIDGLPIYDDYDHDEYEAHLDKDLDVENTDHSDDQITAELLDCLDVLDSESLTPAPEEKPEWEKKKEDVLEYYNKVKTWHTDPKVKTASKYNIDVERLNEWLGEGENDMKIKKQDSKLLNEDGEQDKTLKAAIDSAEKVLNNPEVYSGEGDIEKALDRALRMNRQQIRNGSRNFINVLFTGSAGTGKTGRIKAWAKKNNINLVKTIAGTMDETDLGGLPAANLADGVAVKLSTNQFDSLGTEPNSVLFLDEWNRAPQGVRATLLNLIQDHEIPDYKEKTGMRFLPNFLFTVAAVNPSDDIGYNTDELDDAEFGRVLEVEVAPDSKVWLDYFRAELNSQLKHAEKNPNKAESEQDIKEIKGRLGIAEKLVTDPRFSFDSQYDIEKSKEAKENHTGNGKILTYRNLTDVLDASDGTKDDFLYLWNMKCNSLKKPTVEEILRDYKDVDDVANSALKNDTDSTVFQSKKSAFDKMRDQIKNIKI